jgi:CO/xanthine dehydrogenase Mo-binding subunit
VSGLPGSLDTNRRLSSWIAINPAGYVTVTAGKVEIGQGIVTALAQIVADELDVDLARVRMEPVSTAGSPDEGYTAGSMSVERSGAALRHVCAEVRHLFLDAAAAELEIDIADLDVADGRITTADRARSTTYWDLAAAVDLDRDASADVPVKGADALRLIGTPVPRVDLAGKVAGRRAFLHDLVFDAMLHGRVVRPPSPGARLVDLGDPRLRDITLVRNGSFVGVVGEREDEVARAAAVVAAGAAWQEGPALPDENDLRSFLKAGRIDTHVVVERGDVDSDVPGARRFSASYTRPFLAHASIGPSCAIAHWDRGRLDVWSHTQGVYPLRDALAAVFGLETGAVIVHHAEGPGCYGHNGSDDAALDAALLAAAVPGRPVRVQWSREDELGWAPFGSAMVVDMEADVDPVAGRIVAWRHDAWSNSHVTRPGYFGPTGLLAARYVDNATPVPDAVDRGGMTRNAAPSYDFDACRVLGHCQLDMPVRASSLRSLGALANVFAAESFMDEIAVALGIDPITFRLAHLGDERGRHVLERVGELSGWGSRLGPDCGRGVAYARYKGVGGWFAVVAEVEARTELRVRRLTICADIGMVVNPDGAANQIEGGAIQATSWTVKERVRFDRASVTSTTWETYPILRFSEVPAVTLELVDRPDEPALGAGELAQGPVAAAIANAVWDAIGLRVRDLPLTPERLRSAALG